MDAIYPETCKQSVFKDDRHDWSVICRDVCAGVSYMAPSWCYTVRRCRCGLVVLTYEHPEANHHGPIDKRSQVVHAHYENKKEKP